MMYITYMMASRHRNNKVNYSIEVSTPTGDTIFLNNLANLNDIAVEINAKFFNSFEVVSRAMVNNWLYYPTQHRGRIGERFLIKKRLDGK